MMQLTYLCKVQNPKGLRDNTDVETGLLIGASEHGGLVLFKSGKIGFFGWHKITVNRVEYELAYTINEDILQTQVKEHSKVGE